MIEVLVALTETGEFEDSGGFRFHKMQETDDGLALEVWLVPSDVASEQLWRIECYGVRAYRLCGEFSDGIRVLSEHPVLLPFTDYVTDLYFYNPAPNPLATIGALWERHRQLVGDWLPFEQFLNVLSKGLSDLLSKSSGKLAGGPVTLVEGYADVLKEHRVKSSTLKPRSPMYWDGERWVACTRPLQALVLQSSYVVAERFDAEKLVPSRQ